jgi:hypothetical protein
MKNKINENIYFIEGVSNVGGKKPVYVCFGGGGDGWMINYKKLKK